MKKRTQKIVVVFKTHFDLGFTGLYSEIVRSYSTRMLPDVVETCTATNDMGDKQRFVWTMPAWPLLHSLRSDETEEDVRQAADELTRLGRIQWHALPFTTHTDFCGMEEFIRGMYFSRKLTDLYGRRPCSAKMTDVPGHSRMLPSLLNKAGVKFLHLGCNPFSTPPDVPRLFYWEGPDGGRVVTFYNKGEYGSSLVPPNDWPYPVWLSLMSTGDNDGPQRPDDVRKLIEELTGTMPEAEVVMGTLDDFFRELEPHLGELPVIKGDLADTWIHGVGSYPYEVGLIRENRLLMQETEKAASLAVLYGFLTEEEQQHIKGQLDSAFEEHLLFDEHTWGLDVKQMGERRVYTKQAFLNAKSSELYRRFEQSWAEKRGHVHVAHHFICSVRDKVMELWGQSAPEGSSIIVFNGLGWTRDGWIPLKDSLAMKTPIDIETGLPLNIIENDGKCYAQVKSIPPLSFKAIGFTEAPRDRGNSEVSVHPEQSGCILENRWYRLCLDSRSGSVTSLIDKKTDHDWVRRGEDGGFGRYQYDIHGDEAVTAFLRTYAYRFYSWGVIDFGRAGYPVQASRTYKASGFNLNIIRGSGCMTVKMTSASDPESVKQFGNVRSITTSLTIYEEDPAIDIAFEMNEKEETPYIESGHLLFPINLHSYCIRFHNMGQVINPSRDIVRSANHVMYCCDQWIDICDDKKGLAIIPLHTPLFSVGEKGILTYRRDYEEKDATLIFNVFNNSWGTNFPQWINGDFTVRYRLIPHEGDWREAGVGKIALEAITPLLSTSIKGPLADRTASSLNEIALIQTDESMEITALKLADDGNGFILRLHEIQGKRHQTVVTLSDRIVSLKACDLLEDGAEDCEITNGRYFFETFPFEVHTFRLNLKLP